MTRQPLEYSSEIAVGTGHEVVIYTLSGDLYGNQKTYALQDEIRGNIGAGSSRLIIDLAKVDKIDSAGIGILASVMWSASQAGGGMVMVAVPPRVEKILGIAMLLDRIDHTDTREAALAMLDRD